jgi:arginase family enzyme
MSARLRILRCRTTDRTPLHILGAKALGVELGRRLGREPELVGAPGEPRAGRWDEELPAATRCLGTAGEELRRGLGDGELPVILAGECTVCLGTMPVLARERPGTKVLWLDAHGDLNLPDTTESGYLGGMCLAGACGLWDAGADPIFPAADVVLAGVRDLDPGEHEVLERSDIRRAGSVDPEEVLEALDGAPTFVHLDLDVLDPDVLPAAVPAPGGVSAAELEELLDGVADGVEVVGVEVTAFLAPEDLGERAALARLVADALAPLLARVA